MPKLRTWLIAWKVFDADGTVSLSNLMFMVLIAKLALAPALDWATMLALTLAIMNHNARKWFAKDKVGKVVADQDKLQSLSNEVKALSNALSFKTLGR